ncbi:MAG: nitrous oxide-stimulated promoter family protein [Wenzhouxiangellaceae bacterium]|nr:nitrous oxide-stimulated promoter family protein [Wenzhouxiangellaceae bacterium]
MVPQTPRLERELATMERMVEIWCADRHGGGPCAECRDFLAYAEQRLAKCPYGAAKPTCAKCPVHCYRRARREQARAIMRHAGPRMMYRHPWLALRHVLDKLRPVRHPMELRGSRRGFSRRPRG